LTSHDESLGGHNLIKNYLMPLVLINSSSIRFTA
jgi:hypothetical protein